MKVYFIKDLSVGFCGAPFKNDVSSHPPHPKGKRLDSSYSEAWQTPYYFSPLFESDTHGYNTRDYTKIDTRLGTNADLRK